MFMTFEGGEGTGKSTQIQKLGSYYQSQGRDVVLTREPGGTAGGEHVRNLLVNGDVNAWSAPAEAMLNNAARDVHLRNIIRPALAANKTVLCDRFMDSTRVYQGVAGLCPMDLIDTLERHVVGDTKPRVTFVFDLDPEIGLQRAKNRGVGIEDRYERKGVAFHKALRAGFLAVAAHDPERCIVLDASLTIDEVWQNLMQELVRRGLG
jgi:dTMP kinase